MITKQPIVALDPGIRTFQAFYSELAVGEIANDFYGKTLLKHIVALDDMTSKLYLKKNKDGSKAKKRKLSKKAKVLKKEFGFNFVHKSKKKKTKQFFYNSKQRQNLKKAIARKRQKIRWLKEELHWKVANFFVKNYEVILIPKFSSKDFAPKIKRKMKNKTVKSLLSLNHSMFLERLKWVAMNRGTKIIESREDYTSKTCTSCGSINNKLGSNKTFICKKCKVVIDRDLNGARNIYLRAMGDTPAISRMR